MRRATANDGRQSGLARDLPAHLAGVGANHRIAVPVGGTLHPKISVDDNLRSIYERQLPTLRIVEFATPIISFFSFFSHNFEIEFSLPTEYLDVETLQGVLEGFVYVEWRYTDYEEEIDITDDERPLACPANNTQLLGVL